MLLVDIPEKEEFAVVLATLSAIFTLLPSCMLLGALTVWFPKFDQLSDEESIVEDGRLVLSTVLGETLSLTSSLLSLFGAGRHGTPGLNSGGSADSLGPASTPHLLETGSGIRARGETLLLFGAEESDRSLVEMDGADTTLAGTPEDDCEGADIV